MPRQQFPGCTGKPTIMNIAVITGHEFHHKYFAYELYRELGVKLIVIQQPVHHIGRSFREKKLLSFGLYWFLQKMLSLLYNFLGKNSMSGALKTREKQYFEPYGEKFAEIPGDIIIRVPSVNDDIVAHLLQEKNIDIICFLGGEIVDGRIIRTARMCSLNFHSGLSPYYNGNKSIFHAVKDHRPNFAGGTLMYITPRVDGGKILAHFIPSIESNDTAADLFMKTIIGAVKLYLSFFSYIREHPLPEGVIQERSFRYTRNIDWTIMDDIRLRRFEKENGMKRFIRGEQFIYYYDLGQGDIPSVCQQSLAVILGKTP